MTKPKISDVFIGDFPVTQGYGGNAEAYARFGLNGHNGIDFGTPVGTQIISAHDGLVVTTGYDQYGYGNYVTVWDDVQSIATLYAHFSKIVVAVNQRVVKGQLLGLSGNTGNSTGPHLHFAFAKTDKDGVRLNKDNGWGGWINPNTNATWEITNPTAPVSPETKDESPIAELEKLRKQRDDNWNLVLYMWSKLGLSGDFSKTVFDAKADTILKYEDQIRADEKALREAQNHAIELSTKLDEQKTLNTDLQKRFDAYIKENDDKVSSFDLDFRKLQKTNEELVKEVDVLKKQVEKSPTLPNEFLEKNKFIILGTVAGTVLLSVLLTQLLK